MKMIIYKNYEKLEFLPLKKNAVCGEACDQNAWSETLVAIDKKIIDKRVESSDDLVRSFANFLQMEKKTFLLEKTIGSDFWTRLKKIEVHNFEEDLFCLLQELASFFPGLVVNNSKFFVKRLEETAEPEEEIVMPSDERALLCESQNVDYISRLNSRLNFDSVLCSVLISVSVKNNKNNKKNNNKYLIFLEVQI